MAGLAGWISSRSATLDAALERACARGTLLCAEVTLAGEVGAVVLHQHRTGARRAGAGQARRLAAEFSDEPVEIMPDRPNIYRLYEDNIGPLTPLIADTLKDAETRITR